MQADVSPAATLERRQWGHWRAEHNDSIGTACSHAVRELCSGDPSRVKSYDWDKTLIGIHVVANPDQRHLPRSQVFFLAHSGMFDSYALVVFVAAHPPRQYREAEAREIPPCGPIR